MSYGSVSLTASAVNATSITLNWTVAGASVPSWSWAINGLGTISQTSGSSTATSASGSVTVTGLDPSRTYSANTWNIQLTGAAGTGSAGSNSVTTQGYSSPNVSFSASPANSLTPTVSWSASGTNGAYSVSVTGGTITQTPSGTTIGTGASGSVVASLSYNTSYAFSFSYTYTSNGYSTVGFATDINYTTPYAVIYDANGGTGAPATAYYASGATVTVGAAPTRAGYSFYRWTNGSNAYAPGATFTMPSSPVTLTAQWIQLYTVTYDAAGGSPTPSGGSYAAGTSLTVGSAPSLGGYSFNYWVASGGLTGAYAPGSGYTMPSSAVTFTASYTVINTPPYWTDSSLSAFVVGQAYSDGVSAAYSPTYSVSAGSLPAGISLNTSNGAITGTPTGASYSYSFTITAANSYGNVSASFSGNIQGMLAVYSGSAWTKTVMYVRNSGNTAWVAAPIYVYNGTSWIVSS